MTFPQLAVNLRRYERTYGPYAFGVVSLLLVWFMIVHPELSRRDGFADKQAAAAHELRAAAEAARTAAEQSRSALEHTRIISENMRYIVDRADRR